jgi:hypothetical protein
LTTSGSNYLQQTSTPSDRDEYDIHIGRTLTTKQSLYLRWKSKSISRTVPNPLLPSDHDQETDRNLICSRNYAIINSLVDETGLGVLPFKISIDFSIQTAENAGNRIGPF